jgi:hypothetical protein
MFCGSVKIKYVKYSKKINVNKILLVVNYLSIKLSVCNLMKFEFIGIWDPRIISKKFHIGRVDIQEFYPKNMRFTI